MAGIQGQPSPKPSAVKDTADSLLSEPVGTADSLLNDSPAPRSAPQGYSGPGAGALQTIADYAPAALGIGGAMLAGPAIVPAAAMAMTGAAAGIGYRQLIEQNILKTKGPEDLKGNLGLGNAIDAAGTEGVSSAIGAIGAGVAKGVAGVIKTKIGQEGAAKIAQIAEKPLEWVHGTVGALRDKVEAPLKQMIQLKTSPLDSEEAGNAIKNWFTKDIEQRFSKFSTANKALTEVSKAMPLRDEPRAVLFDETMDWARNTLGSDNQKLVKKWMNNLIESENMAQFESVVKELNRATSDALETFGASSAQTRALQVVRDRAESFMENQVGDLAKRISGGTASMQEMNAFQQMMGLQSNPTLAANPKNLAAYTKSVADDYLSGKKSVQKYYSQFRGLLSDIGEQTKIDPTGTGARDFINELNSVPSEKLVEKMFDPKNAERLRALRDKLGPDVYDVVIKNHMNDVVQKSLVNGQLDLDAFRNMIDKMPKATRKLLMSEEDMQVMNQVLDSQRRGVYTMLQKQGEEMVGKWAARLYLAAHSAEKAADVSAKVANNPMIKQISGRLLNPLTYASPLLDAYGTGSQNGGR